ncbi:helix-turn-helix domain-containing protein [Staphylococcus kloosii]|jgi:transcriptional regulator with XRE-family HTH domain|uniref:helix-turn-helix domain-containing protein n=1 Tax=Staphylococcus kloosii TaxID=29384 RepID=UPI00189E8411|nr:helix-turn-helix transcriptional regulator [Staphylococcus kloosii]MBF7023642.1 helix-turn-helix transcriptional regulator [Staphylococcus kloosii]
MEDFGSRLKYALEKRGFKQKDLSNATGIGVSSISDYIKGRNLPKRDKLNAILTALNVTEDFLFGHTDDMDSSPYIEHQIDTKIDTLQLIESVTIENNIEFVNKLLHHYESSKIHNDNTFENINRYLMELNNDSLNEVESFVKWKKDNQ